MGEIPTYRCTHYTYAGYNARRIRCEADATHRLLDEDGWRCPGGIYCEAHATEIVTEYREKLNLFWTTQTLEEATDGLE